MSDGVIAHVNIGCIGGGEAPTVLKATLGSCVGIALLWPQTGRAAMAHCLLPSSALAVDALHARAADIGPARCVDQAVPALLALLQVAPDRRRQLHAHLAGGAQMRGLALTRQSPGIGELNIRAARSALAAAGIRLVGEHVGGDTATTMTVDCTTMTASSCRIDGMAPSPR